MELRTGAAALETPPPRALFADLVARALHSCRVRSSPEATAYLVELLADRVRAADPDTRGGEEPTLAEGLLEARLQRGAGRVARMRALGDRALFVAGFFGDSLTRSLVDLDYYRVIGRTAYGELSGWLAATASACDWARLFDELAGHFGEFTDVLAEVGDRARAHRPVDLLRLYERYLRTGSARDRQRLLRLGHLPPPRVGVQRCQ